MTQMGDEQQLLLITFHRHLFGPPLPTRLSPPPPSFNGTALSSPSTSQCLKPCLCGPSMKVGVVGAGNVGKALAVVLVKAGHSVRLSTSRGPETLEDLAASTGATAATVQEAIEGADLIVIAIPERTVPDLPKDLLKDAPDSVPVVDTGHTRPPPRLTRCWCRHKQPDHSPSAVCCVWLIMAHSLQHGGLPPGHADRIVLPVAGDDAPSRRSCASSMRSASMRWTPAAWRSRGGSSPALRHTARI